MLKNIKEAVLDFVQGISMPGIWLMHGWFDIKLRYRRSLLGPFWLTISIASMVFMLGFLYSQIYNLTVSEYLPFLGIGLIIWFYIAALVNESCFTFINSAEQIKQLALPISVYALRLVWRNIIIFLHNFIVIVLLLVYFGSVSWNILLVPFIFVGISLFFCVFAVLLGLISARYRDVPQIVATVTQILIFATPIFWKKEFLTDHEWVTLINPAYHLLELMRAPLLGQAFPFQSLYISLGLFAVMFVVTIVLMAKNKTRLIYWV